MKHFILPTLFLKTSKIILDFGIRWKAIVENLLKIMPMFMLSLDHYTFLRKKMENGLLSTR